MDQLNKERTLTGRTRTMTFAGVGLFTALALILNFSHIQIPAPYLPFLIYELWEIPIVACLLIFGIYAGVLTAVINSVVLLLVNQGASAAGPLFNLIAVVVTIVTVAATHRASLKLRARPALTVAAATGAAMVVRTLVMSAVNYFLLPLPPPLGFSFPLAAVIPILPLIAFFNATVVLYSVPLGYLTVRGAASRIHFKMAYPT